MLVNGFLLSRANAPFYESKSIVDHHFKPLLEKVGVEYKTLKATRHTYISLMRNVGVSSDLIIEIVGHSKDVSNKHYYTASASELKAEVINNAFYTLEIGGLKQEKKAH